MVDPLHVQMFNYSAPLELVVCENYNTQPTMNASKMQRWKTASLSSLQPIHYTGTFWFLISILIHPEPRMGIVTSPNTSELTAVFCCGYGGIKVKTGAHTANIHVDKSTKSVTSFRAILNKL